MGQKRLIIFNVFKTSFRSARLGRAEGPPHARSTETITTLLRPWWLHGHGHGCMRWLHGHDAAVAWSHTIVSNVRLSLEIRISALTYVVLVK